jgi:hypothetical protein
VPKARRAGTLQSTDADDDLRRSLTCAPFLTIAAHLNLLIAELNWD